MICGGVGGVALWVAIFPADVCKSRIQVQAVDGKAAPTFLATITQIFKNEGQVGVKVFFHLCIIFVLFVCSVFRCWFRVSFQFFLLLGGGEGDTEDNSIFICHCNMHFISLVIWTLFNTLNCVLLVVGEGWVGGLLHQPVTSIVGFSCFTERSAEIQF